MTRHAANMVALGNVDEMIANSMPVRVPGVGAPFPDPSIRS